MRWFAGCTTERDRPIGVYPGDLRDYWYETMFPLQHPSEVPEWCYYCWRPFSRGTGVEGPHRQMACSQCAANGFRPAIDDEI